MLRHCLVTVAALIYSGGTWAQSVSITVNLDEPQGSKLFLSGQSAFLTTTIGSASSGGQLDGVQSGTTGLGYIEAFPPASISDYRDFGYFGRVDRFDFVVDNDTGDEIELLADNSVIIAVQSGVGVGQTLEEVTGVSFNEGALLLAMTQFDQPEFFSVMNAIFGQSQLRGVIGVPEVSRMGTTLDLLAFVDGPNGDLGRVVGSLSVEAASIPEPSALGLVCLVTAGLRRRRR